jgi:cytidine deaminase
MAALAATVGDAVAAEVAAIAQAPASFHAAATIDAGRAAELVRRHGLVSTVELALLTLPVARTFASPPISGYRVAAVGIEDGSGDLVLGGNLEFPGTELTTTVHAEGFVSIRARNRGRMLAVLAVSEAHPCAHCRQTLSESAGADGLEIVDPLGHRLRLDDLYPWPFRPAQLGMPGDDPSRTTPAGLAIESDDGALPPIQVGAALIQAGGRAHAPYSGAPSAVAVRLRDGRIAAASCVESVAFNPSISALQAVLVDLAAARIDPVEIEEAWLVRTSGGSVDPRVGFVSVLGNVAPDVRMHALHWAAGEGAPH